MSFIGQSELKKKDLDPQDIKYQKESTAEQIKMLEVRLEKLKKHYKHLAELEKQ